MKKLFVLALASIFLMVFLSSCTETTAQAGEEATGESTTTTSTTVESSTLSVPVYLTDKKVSGVESIYVDISGISYTYEASGEASVVSVSTSLKNVDMLSLSGTEMEWFEMRLPEGAELRWIEFGIDSATAVVGGVEVSVEVPHGKVKVVYEGKFDKGEELVLDFDMSQSLVRTGRDMYKLKPVIRPFKRKHGERDMYTISGEVEGSGVPLSGVIVALLKEGTVVRSTYTNREGEFKLRCVKEGTYTLNVYDIDSLPDGSELTDMEASYSTMLYVNEDVDLGDIDIEEATESSFTENATVSVSFTDDPSVGLGVDHVYVHVNSVTFRYEYDGKSMNSTEDLGEKGDIDIMKLIGEKFDAAALPVPSGAYLTGVEVELGKSVEIVVNGENYQINLKDDDRDVEINFERPVQVTGDLSVTLDFDMIQSLFKDSTGYSFNPVIKGMVEDPKNPQYKVTGKVLVSLGGVTTQPAPGFVITLFRGDKLFRLTLTKSDGTFKVFNVPNGDYTLKIYQPQILEPGQDITDLPLLKSEDVTVSSTDLNLGSITVSVSF